MTLTHADESLWREYRTRLFRFVVTRVADAATAEDIVHDVLVRAYDRRDTLRNSDRFEQWLYQITRNAIVDHYRARRPSDPLPPDLAALDDSGDGSARRELAACIAPLLESLPDHYRAAVALAELEGRTQQDTARALGLSLSGAKSRVQRGRRMLEEKLLECCRVEFDSRGGIADFESRDPGTADAAGCGPC